MAGTNQLTVKRDFTGTFVKREIVLHPYNCNHEEKDIEIMNSKLQEDPECLNRVSLDNFVIDTRANAVIKAAYMGHFKCVEWLISVGADINAKYGSVDLITASSIHTNMIDILDKLFENKLITLHLQPNNYVYEAVNNYIGSDIYLKLLLKHDIPVDNFNNFNITLKNYHKISPTVRAILYYRDCSILKVLLLHGAAVDYRHTGRNDLNPEVKDCLSLIHHVAINAFNFRRHYFGILNTLYEFGANFWDKNRNGLTPIEVRLFKHEIENDLQDRNKATRENYNCRIKSASRKITNKMEELMRTPLRLKSLCRISMMRVKGSEYPGYVEELQDILPVEILQFLRAEDLPFSENCSENEEMDSDFGLFDSADSDISD